jgi:hypothetical protein
MSSEDPEEESDDSVVVYRTAFLHEADMVSEAMSRARMPHSRRVETTGGWSVAMPVNPSPGLLPGNFFAIAVPGSWAVQAVRFVSRLPVSQEIPSTHQMPGAREVFRGWTWIFVLAILLVLIVGVIRMYLL